ncbi:MAG: ABC transporter permease [Vicinamibacterales bacterium]
MLTRYRSEISVGVALLLLCAVLAVRAPAYFHGDNLVDILMSSLPVLVIGIGMTLVMLVGEIDISVASVFAIAGVLAGSLATWQVPLIIAFVSAPLAGALLGAFNGMLVARFRIPSIVATLATMVALRDALRWVTQGAWVQNLPPGFQWLGLPQGAYPAAAAAVVLALVGMSVLALAYLAAGRQVFATGSNPEAARLAGIDVPRLKFWLFVLAGGLTGTAALLNAVRFNQIPGNAGLGLEMKVIAAVLVGGTSVTGGRGSIAGTVLGVVLLGAIGPALTFLGASPYWERAIQGAIILTAVAFDARRTHRASVSHSVVARSQRAAT